MPWALVEFDIIALTGWTFAELDAQPAGRLMQAWDLYNTRARGQAEQQAASSKKK